MCPLIQPRQELTTDPLLISRVVTSHNTGIGQPVIKQNGKETSANLVVSSLSDQNDLVKCGLLLKNHKVTTTKHTHILTQKKKTGSLTAVIW